MGMPENSKKTGTPYKKGANSLFLGVFFTVLWHCAWGMPANGAKKNGFAAVFVACPFFVGHVPFLCRG